MKKSTLISIAAVSVAVTTLTATTALAGDDLKNSNGVPQQIQALQAEIATLQSDVQSQSSQISGLTSKLSSDEQTISQLKSTVTTQEDAIKVLQSSSVSGTDVKSLESELNELMYLPTIGSHDASQIVQVGTTPDGSGIWEISSVQLSDSSGLPVPLSKLDLTSINLSSTTLTAGYADQIQTPLHYVGGTPQQGEFTFVPVDGARFAIEFTMPADVNPNNSDGVTALSVFWNDGVSNIQLY